MDFVVCSVSCYWVVLWYFNGLGGLDVSMGLMF